MARLVADASAQVGHPFATSPGVPVERVRALVVAFNATMIDPEFLKGAEALTMEIEPMDGAAIQTNIEHVLATPTGIKARGKRLLE